MWENKYTVLATIQRNPDGSFARPEGKKITAFLENWKSAEPKTDEQIKKHFERPNAALALITGQKNGVTVIDFDTTDSEKMVLLSEAAPTRIIKTERGFHFYYTYISDKRFYTKAGLFGDGIDCRNDGGLVFCPPTPNYTVWLDEPLGEMTEEGARVLFDGVNQEEHRDLKNTQCRNDDLFRAGCGWIDHYTEEETWSRMVQANKEFTKGELSIKELETLFQQVKKYKKPEESEEEVKVVHLSELAKAQGEEVREPIGMGILDRAMEGGLTKGSAVVIAALAGEGKTAFMQTISYHYAKRGITSLWFAYEETVSSIWGRFKAMGLDESHQLFCPIDTEENKLAFIEKVIIQERKKRDIVVFVDQLSNLAPKDTDAINTKHLASNFSLLYGIMSQQLKAIAMDNKVIIFFAHQLNRNNELAYSDMVRHAPDKVIFIQRERAEEKKNMNGESDMEDQFTDKTFVAFNKNRPLGTRPKFAVRVDKGIFVPYNSDNLVEYAKQLFT